ncbi:hypothetical protein Pcinc_000432 [Petrolisthes cinctipes]|uniref:Uncharacterized protein n=1 Tax=Petrolisthes cinctipes TaxID=88211 RepID=A0AAE1GPP3_PETCI|nr:hypothetical protein Pcinc_006733 [Petrolisthes cinctipes]KAK3893365.1 hypothetical protein Pcinc_002799 [Petrolisthes cinctipes]KAK3895816.1 hypothetical protein Pcinc_000432 [Petrolisthes cinctipes]
MVVKAGCCLHHPTNGGQGRVLPPPSNKWWSRQGVASTIQQMVVKARCCLHHPTNGGQGRVLPPPSNKWWSRQGVASTIQLTLTDEEKISLKCSN